MFNIMAVQRVTGRMFIETDIRPADLSFYVEVLINDDYDFIIHEGQYRKSFNGETVLIEEFKCVGTFVNDYYSYDSGSKLPASVIKLLSDDHKTGAPLR